MHDDAGRRDELRLPIGPEAFDAVAWGPEDGEPVLLLHGFPETSWAWRYVQPPLAAAGYRSVAPDQRGYSPGARPADPARYAIDALVDDALGMADALGWDRFHLVGHDWGGTVAWHLAARAPGRVQSLAVASTPHPRAWPLPVPRGHRRRGRPGLARCLHGRVPHPGSEVGLAADGAAQLRDGLVGTGLDPASAEPYAARAATPQARLGLRNWSRGAELDDADACGEVTVPTLYVWSDADVALGPTAAHGTAAHVVGPYRFEVLEGVSHWIPEEAATELVSLLLEHLGDAEAV
ncbi:MAG: alpha/beta hydrolase [Acidimicrobiales bacterium]